jgi:hypothetical protein
VLPLSFIAWREWIHGAWTVPELPVSEPRLECEISPQAHDRLLATSYRLLEQNEFLGWSLEPSTLDALCERYLELVSENGEPLPPDLLRNLLRRGVEQIMTPSLHSQLRRRLYRTAPLLRELYPEDRIWQWAVAAADALREESPLAPSAHPFLLGLVGASLQFALDREIDYTTALKEEE